ncbi:zinc ribbon domain-containing protein [Atopococcus tabaci]|uniref:zinc ribbon domain-containing protein n=1 Tax=Atopococcus tabaci TaxID=269774 RepID=UPI0003FCD752|nr:zinc ribbon domain-containing protein [Atopococcus tabaci]
MNYCTQCGNELQENALFCAQCGTRKGETVPKSDTVELNAEQVKAKLTQTLSKTKGTIEKSGYLDYLKETAAAPSRSLEKSASNVGWIHFSVLTLVTMLSLYGLIAGVVNMAFNEMAMGLFSGFGSSVMSEVRSIALPRLLMVSLTYYAIFAGAAFAGLKVLSRSTQSFAETLVQYGGLFTPNMVLLAVMGVLTYFFASEGTLYFAGFTLGFVILLSLMGFNYFLYSRSIKNKMDTLYVLLLSNIALFFVIALVLYIQIEPLLTALDNISQYGW